MLDLALLAILGLLFVRGWMRGFIRAAVSLGVVVIGTLLALRLSGAVGGIVQSMLGFSDDVSRVVGGVVIFLVISIGAAVLIRVLHLGARLLPGVTTMNRAGGAIFSVIAGVLVMALVLSVVVVVNPSDTVGERLDESKIVSFLTDDDGVTQGLLSLMAGDQILATTLRLQDLFGEKQVVATDGRRTIPATDPADIKENTGAADRIVNFANRVRVRSDLDPLSRNGRLDELAMARAQEIAASGLFSLRDAEGRSIQERIDDEELRFTEAVDIVVLGATAGAVNDAIESHDEAFDIVKGPYRRVGVGAVRTDNGLVVVTIYSR